MEVFDYLLGKKSSGGGGGGSNVPDWTQLGYTNTPQQVINDFNYSKNILDNWDNTITDLTEKFKSNKNLVYVPLIDTSNATTFTSTFHDCGSIVFMPLLNTSNATTLENAFNNCEKLKSFPQIDTSKVVSMKGAFQYCRNLVDLPILDTSKITGSYSFQNAFSNCNSLSDESFDNVLQMCINATSYKGIKTLYRLGFNHTYYPVERVERMPHYQAFLNANWTIGYE